VQKKVMQRETEITQRFNTIKTMKSTTKKQEERSAVETIMKKESTIRKSKEEQ
jgi:hypothetical protein